MTKHIRKPSRLPTPKGDESAAEYRKRLGAATRTLNDQADAWQRSLLTPELKEPRWVKFRRNLCYEGVDYGPDYPQDLALIDGLSAYRFVRDGAAVYVGAPPQELPSNADREFDLDDALMALREHKHTELARKLLISAHDEIVPHVHAKKPEDAGKLLLLDKPIIELMKPAKKLSELSDRDRKLWRELRSLHWTAKSSLQSMTFQLELQRDPSPEGSELTTYWKALKPWKEFNNQKLNRNDARLRQLNFFTSCEDSEPFVIPADWI